MADQSKVAAVANRLHALGGRRGAFLLLLNAAAQSQAADVRDLSKAPRVRAGIEAAPDLHPANDQSPASPAELP